MKILTKQQVLTLHSTLVGRFGGTDGVRDMGMLESALAAPFQTFGGEPLCPSLLAKAARLGFGLVNNHPFLDGNKRIGAHAMLVFLALNGVRPIYTRQELIDLILSAARGEASSERILQWLLEHEG